MKSYQQFFAELKRRQVFKVAGIYGIVSFGVLQAADLMLPRLGLPDWTVTFMVAVVVLAFPVVLMIAWAFDVSPDGVRRTDAASPGELEALVAAPPARRWPAGILALVGIAALILGAWWVGRRSAPLPAGGDAGRAEARLALGDPADDERPSVAVLPFADMSAEGDQEYFSDGMSDEILNTLSRIRGLRVAGRTSAFAYKGEDKDLREIGDELGVRYVVEGSVRKDGETLRISAVLIDAEDGSRLWSEDYDRELESVFAIQTEIAEAVADALRVPLGLASGDDLVTPTADLRAYDLYLAGRSLVRERGAGLAEAIRLFEAAIARDSNWAPGWAGLAEAKEISVWYPAAYPEASPSDYIPTTVGEAERAAHRALELDPDNASALVALGSVHRDRAEWADAEAAYLKAIALDPDNAEAHQQYAELLLNVGRVAEAVHAADRAAVLDPAPIRFGMLSTALVMDDRLAESIEVYDRLLAPPGSRRTERLRARRYVHAGRWDDAVDALDRWNRAHPERDDPFVGDRAEVAAAIDGLRQGTLSGPVDGLFNPATQWMMLGQPDSAIAALLERAETVPFGRTLEMWRRGLEPLRSDPRIEAFFAERGLAGARLQRTPVAERTRPLALRRLGG